MIEAAIQPGSRSFLHHPFFPTLFKTPSKISFDHLEVKLHPESLYKPREKNLRLLHSGKSKFRE
jgi:hypothetical protein